MHYTIRSSTIDTFISEHTAVLAPRTQNTPEVLSVIFLWCLPMGAKERKRHANDSRAGLQLLEICCNLNPQTLVIPDLCINWRNVQSNAWLVNTALSMSACPLTIDLTITSDVGVTKMRIHAWMPF